MIHIKVTKSPRGKKWEGKASTYTLNGIIKIENLYLPEAGSAAKKLIDAETEKFGKRKTIKDYPRPSSAIRKRYPAFIGYYWYRICQKMLGVTI